MSLFLYPCCILLEIKLTTTTTTNNNNYQKSPGKDCGKKHMSVKMVQNDENSDSSGDIDYAFGINQSRKHQKLGVSFGNVPLDIIVDSGATVNVTGQNTCEYLKENKIDCVSRKCSHSKIYTYGSPEPLPVIGTFETIVKAGKCEASCQFSVIKGDAESLLLRESSEQLGLLKIRYNVNYVVNPEKEAIKQQYPGIASGVGKKKNQQIRLHIGQNVVPTVQYQPKLAFSQKPKVEAKIWKMLDEDVIEPVTGPTAWVNPLVVVPKYSNTGKSYNIRICIDMRRANEAIMREPHPIPTVDEALQNMNVSNYFSQLDLRWGYNQLELSPERRDNTTFVTHIGLFDLKDWYSVLTPRRYTRKRYRASSEGCQV